MKTEEQPLLSISARLVLVLGMLAMALGAPASEGRAHAPVAYADTLTVCASGCNYTTISGAINAAGNGDIISVVDAVHTESGITVRKDVIIQGQGADTTIVQAQTSPGTADHRVFAINAGVTSTIQNMTVRHGSVVASPAQGGGIHNSGTLTLKQVVITANRARGNGNSDGEPAYGGGIYNSGTLTVQSSTISGNAAQGGHAGGDIGSAGNAYGGGIHNEGDLTIQSSNVIANTAQGGNAAGLYGGGGDAYGGGIHNKGDLTIQSSNVTGNTAQGGASEGDDGYAGDAYGGGVAQRSSGTGTDSLANSTISGNTAQGGNAGGGNGEAGSAYGGGVAQLWFGSGTLALSNSTISHNTAQAGEGREGLEGGNAEGGGVRGSNGLTLGYCTVVSNQALGNEMRGGGLYSSAGIGSGPEIKSNIIADNGGPSDAADGPDLSGNAQSQNYNLIENPNGYVLSGATGNNIEGSDPLLGPLQDNGGPTQTHALQQGSPAINHIPNGRTGCGTTVTEDQRGVTRPQDVSCDIGAFELAKTGLLEVVKDLKPATDPGAFHLQIDGAIEKANASDGDSTGEKTVSTGTHTVGEAAGSFTDLTDYDSRIECREDGGQGAVVASSNDAGPLTVVVDEDEHIVCTIRNTRISRIIIEKRTLPPGRTGFGFADDITPPYSFSLDDGQRQIFAGVAPGSYSVTEEDPAVTPGSSSLLDLTCVDSDAGGTASSTDLGRREATINLDVGETVTCTFTNGEQGAITIVKDAQPDSRQWFVFAGDLGDFALQDRGDGANSVTFSDVAPGDYAVREIMPDGWYPTSIACEDPGEGSTVDLDTATAFINLEPGEAIICTFENRNMPDLSITKSVTPTLVLPGHPITFTLVFSNAGSRPARDVVITDVVPSPLTNVHFESDWAITPMGRISYTWDVGRLAPGEGGVITLTGVISPELVMGLTFTNTAAMTTDGAEWDSNNSSDSAVVTVQRLAPLAVDDWYSTWLNTPLASAPQSVLDNDIDVQGNPLTAELDQGPEKGTLVLSPDGTFVYTPTLDFVGVDTFVYHANNGLLDSNTATVTLSVKVAEYVYLPMVLRLHP